METAASVCIRSGGEPDSPSIMDMGPWKSSLRAPLRSVLRGSFLYRFQIVTCSALGFPGNLGNTPIEVMESLAPIKIIRREIRRGSGGCGQYNGGCGISFEYEILRDSPAVTVSLLMTQLKSAPEGLGGGGAGQPGQLLLNGVKIDPTEPRVLRPGDRVLMETAGGGGYGNRSG